MTVTLLALGTACLLVAGCSRNTAENTAPAGATPAPPSQQQPSAQPGQLPPGHPPIDQAGASTAAPAGELPSGHPPIDKMAPGGAMSGQQIVPPREGTGTGQAAISWTPPKGWTSEQPSSSMRRAQYRVPGPAGDGECVVFYFGPNEGGDPKANADRWIAQFKNPDGSPVAGKTSEMKVGSIPVTLVEVAGGTYGGSMMMGGNAPEKPNYALLGAIAKGPDANWFFKFTGPEATVKSQRAAFESMVKSLKQGA